MGMTDPIADMLTRMRNAVKVRHATVLMPASQTKVAIADILKQEGYIRNYQLLQGSTPQKNIRIDLAYFPQNASIISGLRRVSKPGLRVYTQKREIPRVFGGLGISILSTSQGVMTGQTAWRRGIGGEVLCYVW